MIALMCKQRRQQQKVTLSEQSKIVAKEDTTLSIDVTLHFMT